MLDFYSMIGFAQEAHAPAALDEATLPERNFALFLDFDGTLADIAERPDLVSVEASVRDSLNRLCARLDGAVAIVSGRDIGDLQRFLPAFQGGLAGGHGAQSRLPGKPVKRAAVDPMRIGANQAAVAAFGRTEPGLLVEHKDAGAAVHYRSCPEMEDKVRAFVRGLVEDDPDFTCQPAKMAFEIKPTGVNKGRAIRQLMRVAPFAGRMPVFAGDDRTDELGFEEVNAAGGVSIKVGGGQTAAQYQCASPAEFRKWLAGLARESA